MRCCLVPDKRTAGHETQVKTRAISATASVVAANRCHSSKRRNTTSQSVCNSIDAPSLCGRSIELTVEQFASSRIYSNPSSPSLHLHADQHNNNNNNYHNQNTMTILHNSKSNSSSAAPRESITQQQQQQPVQQQQPQLNQTDGHQQATPRRPQSRRRRRGRSVRQVEDWSIGKLSLSSTTADANSPPTHKKQHQQKHHLNQQQQPQPKQQSQHRHQQLQLHHLPKALGSNIQQEAQVETGGAEQQKLQPLNQVQQMLAAEQQLRMQLQMQHQQQHPQHQQLQHHQLYKQPIYQQPQIQHHQQQLLFPPNHATLFQSATCAMVPGLIQASEPPLIDHCCQQKQRSQSTCSSSSTSTAGTSITTGSSCSLSLTPPDAACCPPNSRCTANLLGQYVAPSLRPRLITSAEHLTGYLEPHTHIYNQQQHQHHQHQLNTTPPPPSRPWLARKQAKQQLSFNTATNQLANESINMNTTNNKAHEFSALSYNVLADRMVNQDMYPNSPPLALDWLYRRQLILNQLLEYEPDIIALQELEWEHYESYFKPELARLAAYESIFEPKSRAKTMDQHRRRRVDGCAIFYKFNKFKLIDRHLLEFNQIAMANAHGSEAMLNRVMTKDNIGLVAVLELTGKGVNLSPKTSNRLLICNTHIHWDPECCDVKLIQTIMLMNELECIAKHHSATLMDEKAFLLDAPTSTPFANRNHLITTNSPSSKLSLKKPSHDLLPLVLLGDFNSMPNSGVTSYLTSGKINSRHKDFKNIRYTSCTNALSLHAQYYKNELVGERRQSTPAWCYYQQPTLSPSMSPPSPESSNSSSASSTSSYMSALDSLPILNDEPPVLNYNHPFNLQSAYEHNTMPYTNYTTNFKAIIDYIFFSQDSLQLLGLLGPLDKGWVQGNKITGLPHIHLPSDHLPLLIKLRFKPASSIKSSSQRMSSSTPCKNSSFRLSNDTRLDSHQHYHNYHQKHTKQNNRSTKKNSNINNNSSPTIWHICEAQIKHEQISRS